MSQPHARLVLLLASSSSRWIVLAFVLLVLLGGCSAWSDCPIACRCRWTSGKKSALCPDGGLDALPSSLDPDTQVLDLSANRIFELGSQAFKLAGLLNLQRVFLRGAGISRIHPRAFEDMGILVELDLSDNHLIELDKATFQDNGRLKLLILNGNPLRVLKANQFPSLSHLKTLELQRCKLQEVHRLAFHNLTALETLRLDGNQLTHLDEDSITPLKRLKTLGLDNNPWRCDCKLREFSRLLTSGNRLYSAPQACSSPPWLEGRRWEEVRTTEFACEPTVKLPVNRIQEEINGNVSLSCLASGDPEPEVWWQLNGGPVNGTTKHRIMDDFGTPGGIVVYSTSLETHRRLVERWSNLTIYNASDADGGDYTCHARNTAGTARETVQVRIPRVSLSSPTLSQTDNWLLWVSLAGGSTLAIFASALVGLVALCICGGARRRHRRAKVKLQASASFGDQEKKLLDLSVTTTATTTTSSSSSSSQHHLQSHQLHRDDNNCQLPSPPGPIQRDDLNHCQPDFELDFDSCSVQEYINAQSAASVTVERLRHQSSSSPQPAQAALFCPLAVTRAARALSPALPGNIFIAVSLASQDCQQHQRPSPAPSPQQSIDQPGYEPMMMVMSTTTSTTTASTPVATSTTHERCYPDLLDIGISSYATLPRRSVGRNRELGSPYDNMGPRITATGSSTFSLFEQPEEIEPPLLANGSLGGIVAHAPLIQPPPEFVSL